jgi:Lipase maturation factor
MLEKKEKTRAILLKLMGFVYLCAFLSLYKEWDGLYGDGGLVQVSNIIESNTHDDDTFSKQWRRLPTILWLASSPNDTRWHDQSDGLASMGSNVKVGSDFGEYMREAWRLLRGTHSAVESLDGVDELAQCLLIAGVLLSAVAFSGFGANKFVFGVLWLLYVSFHSVGRIFLNFQWDSLLLETGALCVLLAPWFSARRERTLNMAMWMFRWLGFRLLFMSGMAKLQSACHTWLGFTALEYHFATQCLPTPLAWFASEIAPVGLLRFAVGATLQLQICASVLLLCPFRLARISAAVAHIGLQCVIALTGNYNFFNLMTIVILIGSLDDRFFTWWRAGKEAQDVAVDNGDANDVGNIDSNDAAGPSKSPEARRQRRRRRGRGRRSRHDEPSSRAFKALVALGNLCMFVGVLGATLHLFDFHVDAERGQVWATWARVPDEVTPDVMFALPFVIALAAASLLVMGIVDACAELMRADLRGLFAGSINAVTLVLVLALFFVSLAPFYNALQGNVERNLPLLGAEAKQAYNSVRHLRLASGYGLFRKMTGVGAPTAESDVVVARPEIVMSGHDGSKWHELHFYHKPGDVERAPTWIAPLQPRVDWQLWFAALSEYKYNPWYVHLCIALLQGREPVWRFVDTERSAPFSASSPPLALRADLYHYRFAPPSKGSTQWWQRTRVRQYSPAVALDGPSIGELIAQQRFHPREPPASPSRLTPLLKSARQCEPIASVAIVVVSSLLAIFSRAEQKRAARPVDKRERRVTSSSPSSSSSSMPAPAAPSHRNPHIRYIVKEKSD